MAFRDLMPGPDEARGVAIGFILSFFLHPIALIAVALIGTAIEPASGGLIALPFLAFIGVTQWLYVLPVFWLLRRRGRRALAKGVLIGGAAAFSAFVQPEAQDVGVDHDVHVVPVVGLVTRGLGQARQLQARRGSAAAETTRGS